jgi:hypothetical protein
MYGPIQTQVSQTSGASVTNNVHPLIFQVNNFAVGNTGPRIYNYSDFEAHTFHLHTTGNTFICQYNNSNAESLDYVPNGPRLFGKYVKLDFKFTGFVNNTRVRVDIVRQKKIAMGDAWRLSEASNNIFPYNASDFKNLAGFTPYKIDRRMYEVMATKHVYMNSAGTEAASSLITGGLGHSTSEPTTTAERYCSVFVPLNREFKQIDPSLDERTGVEHDDLNASTDASNIDGKGSWQFTNQRPQENIFAVVSCDDTSNIADLVLGARVKMECIRTCSWRDHRGEGA